MAGAWGGEEGTRDSVLLPHTVTAVPPALLCGSGPAPGGLVPAAAGRASKGTVSSLSSTAVLRPGFGGSLVRLEPAVYPLQGRFGVWGG